MRDNGLRTLRKTVHSSQCSDLVLPRQAHLKVHPRWWPKPGPPGEQQLPPIEASRVIPLRDLDYCRKALESIATQEHGTSRDEKLRAHE